jgi:hypothetical protein
MSDNRKNNGGAREGAGRKSKAEEMGLPALINEVIGEEGKKSLVEKLKELALKGDIKAVTLLMAYIFGKPSDSGALEISDDVESVTINYHKPGE